MLFLISLDLCETNIYVISTDVKIFFNVWIFEVVVRIWGALPEESQLGFPLRSTAAAESPKPPVLGLLVLLLSPRVLSEFLYLPFVFNWLPSGEPYPSNWFLSPQLSLMECCWLLPLLWCTINTTHAWFLLGNMERLGCVVNITGWLATGDTGYKQAGLHKGGSDLLRMCSMRQVWHLIQRNRRIHMFTQHE